MKKKTRRVNWMRIFATAIVVLLVLALVVPMVLPSAGW